MAVRKIAITLPEEMYDLVERARQAEHRSRSEVIQDAIRTHFGQAGYKPTVDELRAIDEARLSVRERPESVRPWKDVLADLRRKA